MNLYIIFFKKIIVLDKWLRVLRMGNILIIRYVEENVLWEKIVNEIFRSKNEGYV